MRTRPSLLPTTSEKIHFRGGFMGVRLTAPKPNSPARMRFQIQQSRSNFIKRLEKEDSAGEGMTVVGRRRGRSSPVLLVTGWFLG